jgi:hypothetical protein
LYTGGALLSNNKTASHYNGALLLHDKIVPQADGVLLLRDKTVLQTDGGLLLRDKTCSLPNGKVLSFYNRINRIGLKPYALKIGRRYATCIVCASRVATTDFFALEFIPMQDSNEDNPMQDSNPKYSNPNILFFPNTRKKKLVK